MAMNLPRDGREYVNWPITGEPDDASFEIRFRLQDGANLTEWLAMESTPTGARILLAGPGAPAGDGLTLPQGRISALIRLQDEPETVLRSGGTIDVA